MLNYNLDTAREHFKQTRDVVAFYNKAFGFYPFAKDGFGLVESPYEGMEHQSAIAYGNGYNMNNSDNRITGTRYMITSLCTKQPMNGGEIRLLPRYG